MQMSRLARVAPLTGVAFFVLALAGVVAMGESPDFAGKPADFTAYYTDDKGRVILGSMVFNLGVFFLLWFLGSLVAASRRAEGGDGRVSRLAYGGGLVGSALLLGGMSINLMAAFRVDEQGAISDDVAVVYGDLSNTLAFLAASIGFAVLLAGVAVVNARTPFLPRWLTWVTGLLALGLFEPFASWAFLLALPVWVVVVASLLFLQQPSEAEASAG
ncbi:MAG TPA: hypothetical protein VMZ11_00555 [Mycobacteriales bacterium]|nr:hypothetical protein [Mycobacteriales bacterium]